MSPRGGRELQNPVGRKWTNRQVVVAGPAESAEVRAATDDLDEEARPEFRIRREDAGRWRVDSLGRAQCGFGNRHRDAWNTDVSGQRSVNGVLRLVERRDVETALERQSAQEVAAVGRRGIRTPEGRDERFALAGGDDVGEGRQRFRVHEGHSATNDNERMVMISFGGVPRNLGES